MERENKPPGPGFWTVTLLFVLFCLALKLPTWNIRHREGDEAIYWQLSRNLVQKGEYNLSGTQILSKLSPTPTGTISSTIRRFIPFC